MQIAFVGSNPSHLGPDSPAIKNLKKWWEILGIADRVIFMNVSNLVTPNNRPLHKSEYELARLSVSLTGISKVVALGTVASDALDEIGIQHFRLPHPSPRNRKLNDKLQTEALLVLCKAYLEDKC